MRGLIGVVVVLSLISIPAVGSAQNVVVTQSNGVEFTCSWGELTSVSIADGFPQGRHSSDPSGDGHGPGTADEPRAGLANVVSLGDLQATCELIQSLLQ